MIEGHGSLLDAPSAAVATVLAHAARPQHYVLCHRCQPTNGATKGPTTTAGEKRAPLPTALRQAAERQEALAAASGQPTRLLGVMLDTGPLSVDEARRALAQAASIGAPAVSLEGAEPLVAMLDALEAVGSVPSTAPLARTAPSPAGTTGQQPSAPTDSNGQPS